jgi:hypothetical protein
VKLQETWKTAKKAWEKNAVGHVRRAALDEMATAGFGSLDLGKLLGKVDQAKTLAARREAWARAGAVVARYENAVAKARRADLDPRGKKGLVNLAEALTAIGVEANAACQDPAPSKRAAELRLVSKMNLAAGLKPVHLVVGRLDVSGWLVVDETLLALEKAGELGFRWTEVQREISAFLEDASKRFRDTILAIDAKLATVDEAQRAKRLAEAREVLEHYRKVVEQRINAIVDAHWDRAVRRQQFLRDFEKECKVDIAVAAVTIAVTSTSVALSFGSAAIGVLAIAKATLEIALTLEKLSRSADDVRKKLEPKMEGIQKLWRQREAARRAGRTDHGSKTLEVGKEAVASAMGQISSRLMTTTSRTLKEARELVGKLSVVEREAGRMHKEIERFTATFPSAPEGPDARANRAIRDAHAKFMAMAFEYQRFTADLREHIRWSESCVEVCENLAHEDWVPRWTKTAGSATKSAAGVAAAAKLVYDLATSLV